MSDKHSHPTDADLLLFAEGEESSIPAATVSSHVKHCWSCRERLQSLEGTIADFARAQKTVALPIATGPRAQLREKLEQEEFRPNRLWGMARLAAVSFSLLAALLLVFEFRVKADGPQPDASLTPGEVVPISISQVCSSPDADVIVENIPLETRRRVFSAYGIDPAKPGEYEVDYLITPDLGGSDSIRNLWPQPYSARWNAKQKDKLEQRLHTLVCAGNMDLTTAQREIAGNWIQAYKKYVKN